MAFCLFLYFAQFLLLALNFLVHIFCCLKLKRDTFMVHCGKYLAISYIFYVFILQKAVLFSQTRRAKFQKFSGPSALPGGASLNNKESQGF